MSSKSGNTLEAAPAVLTCSTSVAGRHFEAVAKSAGKGGLTLTRRFVVYFGLPAESFSVPNAFGTWKVF